MDRILLYRVVDNVQKVFINVQLDIALELHHIFF